MKTKVINFGGLLGSALKEWWVSGSLPYRKGFSGTDIGVFGSILIERSNALEMNGFVDPKDAIEMAAESELDEERS